MTELKPNDLNPEITPENDRTGFILQLKTKVAYKQSLPPGPSKDLMEAEIREEYRRMYPGKRKTAHVSGSRPK